MSTISRPGLVPQQTIDQAARLLLQAAPQGSEVILFGSYARGNATPHSDIDFLVIEPILQSQHAEMVRLRDTLCELSVPVDVLVTSREVYESWKLGVNSVIARAHREGRRYAATA